MENLKNRGEKSPLLLYMMYDLSIFFAESERLVFKNYTKISTVARERAVLGLIGDPGPPQYLFCTSDGFCTTVG